MKTVIKLACLEIGASLEERVLTLGARLNIERVGGSAIVIDIVIPRSIGILSLLVELAEEGDGGNGSCSGDTGGSSGDSSGKTISSSNNGVLDLDSSVSRKLASLGGDSQEVWALSGVSVIVSVDLNGDVFSRAGVRGNNLELGQDLVNGGQLASELEGSLSKNQSVHAGRWANLGGINDNLGVGRVLEGDLDSHLEEGEFREVNIVDLNVGVEGNIALQIVLGWLCWVERNLRDGDNRGGVNNLDIEDDGGDRGLEGGDAVIQSQNYSVVLNTLTEIINRAGSKVALDRSDLTIDDGTSLNVKDNVVLVGVSLVVDLGAVQSDEGVAGIGSAELEGSLVLGATTEGDGELVRLRVKSGQVELVTLLLNSDDTVNRVNARLLVDRGDIDGDGLLVRDGILVITDNVTKLAVVSLRLTVLINVVLIRSFLGGAEAEGRLQETRLVLVDGLTNADILVVVQRTEEGCSGDTIHISQLVGQERTFDVVTTERDELKSGVPPVLLSKVFVELAVIVASSSGGSGPSSEEISGPGGVFPDKRRNVDVSDGDQDLLGVGLEVRALQEFRDLVVEARKSQELRADGIRVLELWWQIDQTSRGELLAVSDEEGSRVLRSLWVELSVIDKESSISLGNSVDNGELVTVRTSGSLLVISKVELKVKRSVHLGNHVGHIGLGGSVGSGDFYGDDSLFRNQALISNGVGNLGRTNVAKLGLEDNTAVGDGGGVSGDGIISDKGGDTIDDLLRGSVESSTSGGSDDGRSNRHETAEGHASQLNDNTFSIVIENVILVVVSGPGPFTASGGNVLNEGNRVGWEGNASSQDGVKIGTSARDDWDGESGTKTNWDSSNGEAISVVVDGSSVNVVVGIGSWDDGRD